MQDSNLSSSIPLLVVTIYFRNVNEWISMSSFKELNAGHVFEWKTTLKGVKVANLIKKNSTLYMEWKIQFHIHLEWNFTNQKCIVLRLTLSLTFSLFPLILHLESSWRIQDGHLLSWLLIISYRSPRPISNNFLHTKNTIITPFDFQQPCMHDAFMQGGDMEISSTFWHRGGEEWLI